MAKGEPLTFEQFTKRNPTPKYNNFFTFFEDVGFGRELKRAQPYFRRFAEEHPELERELTDKITNRDSSKFTADSLAPFEKDLYQAYLIMRQYIEDDTELFS